MALRRIQQRKERRQKMVMSIVLTFLMVASGFGIYLSGRGAQQQSIRDHGLVFSIDSDNGYYTAKVGGQRMSFYYLPSSVQDIPFSMDAVDAVRGANATVITFDPTLEDQRSLQAIDTARFDFAQYLGKPVINAVSEPSQLYSLPVLSCANATAGVPVISLERSSEPSVSSDGDCVRISGNTTGFLEARDRFLYEYYGVYGGV